MSSRLLCILVLAATVAALSACANREKKSSAPKFYNGNAPTIKMTGREDAGGPLGGY